MSMHGFLSPMIMTEKPGEDLCAFTRASILYDIKIIVPKMIPLRMTCMIASIDPERRRGYLGRMYAHPLYKRLSRRRKVEARRMLLLKEVAEI